MCNDSFVLKDNSGTILLDVFALYLHYLYKDIILQCNLFYSIFWQGKSQTDLHIAFYEMSLPQTECEQFYCIYICERLLMQKSQGSLNA